MSITNVESGYYPEVRQRLRHELTLAYHELFYRAHQSVLIDHPRISWPRTFIAELLELAIEAIHSGDYDELFTWVANLGGFDEDRLSAQQQLCKVIIKSVEEISEQIIPAFCPLLGEITLRVSQFENILHHSAKISVFSNDQSTHSHIDVAIDDIIRSLDRKDLATGEHSRVVSLWCQQIAQKLCLSKELTLSVTRGGLIHDLGKTTVPLEILQAPRRLTDDEWKIMASHVTAGHAMILQMPALHDFQSMVRNHHEQFLGGGYPDNLSRDEIPFVTRIVTVADSFNAMIGRRPYRKQMSPEKAIRELRHCRGKQFDPDVVDAMTEIVYKKLPTNGAPLPPDWRWKPRPLAED